jgi:hypothetical protein
MVVEIRVLTSRLRDQVQGTLGTRGTSHASKGREGSQWRGQLESEAVGLRYVRGQRINDRFRRFGKRVELLGVEEGKRSKESFGVVDAQAQLRSLKASLTPRPKVNGNPYF